MALLCNHNRSSIHPTLSLVATHLPIYAAVSHPFTTNITTTVARCQKYHHLSSTTLEPISIGASHRVPPIPATHRSAQSPGPTTTIFGGRHRDNHKYYWQMQPEIKMETPADTTQDMTTIQPVLPLGSVFPIQIGCQLFKLSGASLSYDAPSYFSQWFLCKMHEASMQGKDLANIPTLYIDRDPDTFRDIALHLQGYHVKPRDGTHFVRLFADAQFYQLPKLISQLYDESIFMSIGGREFKIPREVFTDPKHTPNYFSLGFAMFFSNRDDLFPGLNRDNLLRPPSIVPPSVPNRSAEVFDDILKMLCDYPVEIHNETHREALLRDARYFNFKTVEQKLIPVNISYNPRRSKKEIVVRIDHIVKSGLALSDGTDERWLNYKRPYDVDPVHMEAIIEIGQELTKLHVYPNRTVVAEFLGDISSKVGKLTQIIAGFVGVPAKENDGTTPGSNDSRPGINSLTGPHVYVILEPETFIMLDGREYCLFEDAAMTGGVDAMDTGSRKRRRTETREDEQEWVVKRGQWRVKVITDPQARHGKALVLVGVNIEATSSERARNATRGFLL